MHRLLERQERQEKATLGGRPATELDEWAVFWVQFHETCSGKLPAAATQLLTVGFPNLWSQEVSMVLYDGPSPFGRGKG